MIKISTFSATEAEIKDARESLVWASELNWNYIIMNCLAAIIASYGLLENSPAVVIGAMIVAMLLGPISSLALGIIDSNLKLIAKSLVTLLSGVLVICIISAFLGWVHRSSAITNEIMARTAPNFMDLMIALGGGMAGVFSLVHKRLVIAFAGVAIATALVPPLASASILLVRGEYALAQGAFLLAFTNIVGIQFGYALILWFKNIGINTKGVKHGIGYFLKLDWIGLTIMTALAVLLTYNLSKVISKFDFENNTQTTLRKEIKAMPGNHLADIRFDKADSKLIINAVVRGPYAPDKNTVAALENTIAKNYLDIPNELRIRFVKTVIISKEGELFNDTTGIDIEQGDRQHD